MHIAYIRNEERYDQDMTKILSILDHGKQIEYFAKENTIIARLVLFRLMIEMV